MSSADEFESMTPGEIAYAAAVFESMAAAPPPVFVRPAPVHPGGTSPVDRMAAAFISACNAGVMETNAAILARHAATTDAAAAAAEKFRERMKADRDRNGAGEQ